MIRYGQKKKAVPSFNDAAAIFHALGSAQRLRLAGAIAAAGNAGVNVASLAEFTGIAGATLHHHMRVLRDAGIIVQRHRGREILNTINDAAFPIARRWMDQLELAKARAASESAA